jgi:hypothetical protein
VVYQEDMLVPDDVTLTLKGANQPASVKLLGQPSSDAVLKYQYSDRSITIQVPAAKRSTLVDVVEVKLSS